MSEGFPKKFDEHFFAIIKAYLKAMMESKTEEEGRLHTSRPNSAFVSDPTELRYWAEFMRIQHIILHTSCTTIQEVST
jgi:hypothetical protein